MRGAAIDPTKGGRPTCYKCMRPVTHCLCDLIPSFTAHCNILILQHPHERKKYYSTARLVTLGLTNAKILRGIEFTEEQLNRALAGQKAYLLYPSKKAEDCETAQLDSNSTVIVIDGTWAEAGKIVHRNPMLKTLPYLSFQKPLRSNYRIRKQPKDNYLSTIESIGHLLKLNAAKNGIDTKLFPYDNLFSGFDQMVEKQLGYFPRMRKEKIASES